MRDKLLALYQLQKIDSVVFEHKRSAQAIPDKIKKLEDKLEILRTELGQLNSEADTFKKEQTDLEAVISEESGKHHKWKMRLNDIKSPREYQALSRELELGERQVKEHEDKALEAIGNYDDLRKVIDGKEAELRAHEEVANKKINELRQAQAKAEAEADSAKNGRDEIVAKVPPGFLKRYEKVRDRRNGLGIGVVIDGTCNGCNVRLRPQHLVQVLKFNSIESCANCVRLLVHEDLIKEADLDLPG